MLKHLQMRHEEKGLNPNLSKNPKYRVTPVGGFQHWSQCTTIDATVIPKYIYRPAKLRWPIYILWLYTCTLWLYRRCQTKRSMKTRRRSVPEMRVVYAYC